MTFEVLKTMDDKYIWLHMGMDKNTAVQFVGIIIILAIAVVSLLKPEISLWFYGFIGIFVISLIIYLSVKDKFKDVEILKSKFEDVEKTVNFSDRIHDLDKRVCMLEQKEQRKRKGVIPPEWIILFIILLFILIYLKSIGTI